MSLFLSKIGLFLKVSGLVAYKAPKALIVSILTSPPGIARFLYINTWDFFLFLGNILTPQLAKGSVIKAGVHGHKGVWPEYVAPKEGDSRSPCPYLNALANHGVLPHDGKNIVLDDLAKIMSESLNFAITMTRDTVHDVAGLYGRGKIDLGDLAAHNVVEHDASLIREDAFKVPDQTIPAKHLINELLASASGPASPEHPSGYLTPRDIARALSKREAQSRKENPVFTLDALHRFFGASNAALLYEAVAGDVELLKTILLEERFPDGFETRMRQRFGLTLFEFHLRGLEMFLLS